MSILIALDNGHGLNTPGKRTPIFLDGTVSTLTGKNFMHEWEFNRRVVELLKADLERHGFKVLDVSPTSEDISLDERCRRANTAKANYFLSVHANALNGVWGSQNGIETFAHEGHAVDTNIARILQKHLVQATGLTDRGVKAGAWLHVINATTMPAALVECGFMDNLTEAKLLLTEEYRKKCAVALAKGLCEAFSIAYHPEVAAPAPKPAETDSGSLVTVERFKGTTVTWLKLVTGSYRAELVYQKSAKVSELVKDMQADFGINFPFFWEGKLLGDSESGDKAVSEAYGKMLKWHEFAMVDGKPVIGQLNKADKQDFLVQGAPLLIENGNPCWDYYRWLQEVPDDIGKSRAQRTAVGIDKDGNLIIVVSDGRTSESPGFTLAELTEFMQSKGAINALNGDGGGSSVLATQAGVRTQNAGASERVVHHALLFYLNKEGYRMKKEDANKLIDLLKAVYSIAPDKEVGRLADELRKASGQPTQNT